MLVELVAPHDQRLEMSREEIGQVEGGWVSVVEREPVGVPREEAIAVVAGKPLDAVLGEHGVQRSARAAVGVCDEHPLVRAGSRTELLVHRAGDEARGGVKFARQALHLDVRPSVQPDDGEYLAGYGAAGKHEHSGRRGRSECLLVLEEVGQVAAAAARRASTSACAVSAAIAASRQYASAPTARPNSSFSGAPPTSTM